MRFRIEQRFAGPLDQVESVFVDPAFYAAMAGLPKVGGAELLDQQIDGDRVHQRVRYRFTGDLSSAARAVINPERLTWVEVSTLDRATHRTTWRIEPDHYPDRITCAGTFALADAGDRTTVRTTEADLKVHLALLGGRVEQAIVSGLREHADLETALIDDWMAGSG